MADVYELFLTCPKGLESLLLEEAQGLGLDEARAQVSAVRGQGSLEVAYRLCLWSRLANRVLLVLARFPVENAESMYMAVHAVNWEDHLDAGGTLAVEFSGKGSGIDNTHFGALKVKDAIVDNLRERSGRRPSVDKVNPDVRVHLHLDRGQATLSLDLSGHSLHQRGYRLQQGAAPLKENLAAAVLIRAGWPKIAAEGGALADPMCGVGTFLVEAALMAADIAPNLRRERWGFSNWLGHVPALWRKLHEEAQQRAAAGLARPPLWIRGYEADPRLIQPARNNIERAGVADWVKIYQGELATFEPRPDKGQTGLVICNPPYGERLGDEASLLYLYQNLGERLRQSCIGWSAGVFTGAPELGKRMGIRSHKQYAFWNGALACKLLMIQVEPRQFVTGERGERNDEGLARAPSEPARLSEGGQMFANRLQKNLRQLGKWARRDEIECYRLYDADMPEYALAVDIYGDWVHVQEYAAPKSIDPAKAQARLFDALAAIPQTLGVAQERVVVKRRERQAGKKQYERQSSEGKFLEVGEGDVRLLVNLTDYLDTGLFLDHRPMRLRIQKEAARQALPQPVLLYRHGHRTCGQGRRAQHHQRRPVEDLPGLGAAQPVAQRLFRQAAPGARRRDGVVAGRRWPVRTDLHRPADLLQLQAHGRRIRRAARPRRTARPGHGAAGAGRGAVFLQQLPQVRTGRERAGPLCGRRDHWRNPRSGFRA